jgi:hypothetical protein
VAPVTASRAPNGSEILGSYGVGVASEAQERAAQQRAEKLGQIRDQVESGDLVIRSMTKEERARWAARDASVTPEEQSRRDAARKGRRQRERRLTG